MEQRENIVQPQEEHVSTAPISRESRKVLVNALSNVVFYVTQVAVVFFVSPILVHGLGDSRYGAWTLVNSILAYMALVDLGVGAAVVRYVARFDGLRDTEATNRVFSTSLFIFACAGTLVLFVTLALVFFWKQPFGVTGDLAVEMRWLLGILGTQFAIALPLSIYKKVLAGLGRYPIINTYRIAALLLRNAAFVLVVHLGGGLRGIGVAIAATALVDLVCPVLAAHYCLPSLSFSFRFVDRATFRQIWSYSFFVFLGTIAFSIGSHGSTIIAGAFLVPAAVAYFGIASNLSGQAVQGLHMAIVVLIPAVSKWDAMGDHSAISRLLVTGSRYLLFLGLPITLGLILLGHPFIALWMGPRYAELCYPALVILSLPLPLALVQGISTRLLEGIGKVASLSAVTAVQAVLMIAVSIALVKPLGIEGIAWGFTVPLVIQSMVVVVMACQASDVRISKFIARACVLPAATAGFLALVWLAARWWLGPISSWAGLLAIGTAGLVGYSVLVACLDPSLRRLARRLYAGLRRSTPRCAAAASVLPALKERC
jgi:O-antigen/teichoic acid export membrane protein